MHDQVPVTLCQAPVLRLVLKLSPSEETLLHVAVVFSSLTLLVRQQKEHLACKKLTDNVLVSLCVWSEGQMVCIWSSRCNCYPVISCFVKIQVGLTILVSAYLGCPGKEPYK